MSWTVNLLKNEPVIGPDCAEELFKAQSYDGEVWYEESDVLNRQNRLNFNYDHYEWIDFLQVNEKFIEILKKYRAKGDICFGSEEGDNKGKYWGYRFDGKGSMKELVGHVVFSEV